MRLELICGCTVHGPLSWHQEKKSDGKDDSGRSALLDVAAPCHRPRQLRSANTLMLHGFDFGVVITWRVATPRLMGSLHPEFYMGTTFCLASTFWPTWHGRPFRELVAPASTDLVVTEARKLSHHDKVEVHRETHSNTYYLVTFNTVHLYLYVYPSANELLVLYTCWSFRFDISHE